MNKKKISFIISLIVVITLLHYTTNMQHAILHIIYRELYFIPIILAGLWGGKKYGLTISVIISLLYIPHIFMLAEGQMGIAPNMTTYIQDTIWGNILQVLIFNIAGFSVGAYGDIRKNYSSNISLPFHPIKYKKNFLIYVDNSPISLHAAQYFSEFFGNIPGIKITLLKISLPQISELPNPNEEILSRVSASKKGVEYLSQDITRILLEGGVEKNNIQAKTLTVSKMSRVSDKIIEEIINGNYDTVLVGKHRLTRSQEFLFGSVTIRLIREAGINVIAVKGSVKNDEIDRHNDT